MIEIDGAIGGGQVVRSALALSAVTGEAVTVTDVRGDRSEPGLKHQHLAAVRVLSRMTDADVEGDELGSEEVVFDPGEIRGGEYEVDIGTAGSVTLLFDAVVPLAVAAPEPIAVTATGGTAVKWSPSMAYYRRVKLPLLRRAGLQAAVDVDRAGYYPVGGGRARLSLAPSSPTLALTDRGDREGARVHSAADWRLADDEVAERQADAATAALREAGVEVTGVTTASVAADSPGSSVLVRVDYGDAVAGFDALGEPGRPAEEVGETAAHAAREFHACPGVVDEHMADQLLPFLGLCGGRVRIPRRTDHVDASLELLAAFDRTVRVRSSDEGHLLVGGRD